MLHRLLCLGCVCLSAMAALVVLDPALFVTPPPGLETGYVPIVTRQSSP